MLKNYEIYLILNPEIKTDVKKDELEKIASYIKTDLNAKDINVEDEGAKKLAYPIKKHWNGVYVSFTFDVDYKDAANMKEVEKKLNISDHVMRYIITDETENKARKEKESLNQNPEATNHQELNKGKVKKDLMKHLGMKVVDYKDVEFLSQFVSPYSKIFHRERTGNSAISQRRIAQAIKRARHMALMKFTPKHDRKF